MTSWIFLVLEWIVFGVVVYAIHKWYYKNRPKPLPKSSMKKDSVLDENSNLFASKAEHYHWRIKTNIKSLRKNANAVFFDLDALSLENGYGMGLRLAEQKGIGDVSNFYVFKNNIEDRDLLKYIHVDETPMGAWQVYLLMTSQTQLPVWWHAGCIKRTFIWRDDDLYNIEPLRRYELSGLLKTDILTPSVEVEKGSGLTTAQIYCSYWHDWQGLVREHIEIQMQNGQVTSYEKKDCFVIYNYNCGIRF